MRIQSKQVPTMKSAQRMSITQDQLYLITLLSSLRQQVFSFQFIIKRIKSMRNKEIGNLILNYKRHSFIIMRFALLAQLSP
ncbi:hypothetical protein FGO68_gene10727 [Halteria grandinella]|uniref:Uncharacterized protein n=1 Tax=Halteria grandinella TaxID=5974 RepID=A0A8J8NTA8_HALGN|nr:hypothetical protein FGO68_gene10727 [Halteria grandinella]